MRRILAFLTFVVSLMVAVIGFAALSGSLDEKKIIERIKPEGQVTIEGLVAKPKSDLAVTVDVGQARYEEICGMCHNAGLADAPKLGDRAAWKPRIDQGIETMVKHAIHGLKAMPPRGGCMTCTDEEIHKTVEYMVSKAK
jgi:cytochrome c5